MNSTDYSAAILAELERLEVEVHEMAIQQRLVSYCEEVERWNRKINLTSLQGTALVRRLVVEPIWIAQKLQIQGTMIDVGSGNGSPAIPMRLVQPIEVLHLVEIRARRAAFLRHLTTFLRLDHVSVHRERFEDAAQTIGPVDWITMQALEPTSPILKAAKLISRETTRVVWITSANRVVSIESASVLEVPFSETRAIILKQNSP